MNRRWFVVGLSAVAAAIVAPTRKWFPVTILPPPPPLPLPPQFVGSPYALLYDISNKVIGDAYPINVMDAEDGLLVEVVIPKPDRGVARIALARDGEELFWTNASDAVIDADAGYTLKFGVKL
jgi:hypothetical protein